MPIPRSTLDTLRDRADLANLFRETGSDLRKEGDHFKTHCPVHEDDTPSLSINPDRGTFHCFGCGWSGDAFDFLQKTEHLSFPEAAQALAEQLRMTDLPGLDNSPQASGGTPQPVQVLQMAQEHFAGHIAAPDSGAEAAQTYLAERGITNEAARRYGVGFAADAWDSLTSALTEHGASEEHLLEAGLVARRSADDPEQGVYDLFRGRITFPFRDAGGRVVGFGARLLPALTETSRQTPKYINSPDGPYFTKGSYLFGIHEARPSIRRHRTIVVVEGYLDVLALAGIGIAAVAPAGTAFTEEQATLLARRGAERVLFVFDGDEGGRRGAAKAVAATLPIGITPYVASLPEGTDPADLVRDEDGEAVRGLLRQRVVSGVRYLATEAPLRLSGAPDESGREIASGVHAPSPALTDTEDRIERANFLCRVIRKAGEPLRRAALAREAARALDLPPRALFDQIEKQLHRARLSEPRASAPAGKSDSAENDAPAEGDTSADGSASDVRSGPAQTDPAHPEPEDPLQT